MARLIRPQLPLPIRLDEECEISVRFGWEELCPIEIDDDNDPVPPTLEACGAVYRLRFAIPDGGSTWSPQYIGQTNNLRRRLGAYRKPAPGKQHVTNRKIHDAIVNTILYGGQVSLDCTVDVIGGEASGGPLNMDREVCRLLVENAAILLVAHHQEVMLLNADEMKRWGERLSLDSAEEGSTFVRPPEYRDLYLQDDDSLGQSD